MTRGYCATCGKQIGGFLKPASWLCERCQKVYCAPSSPKVGLVLKKPASPQCGIEHKRLSSLRAHR